MVWGQEEDRKEMLRLLALVVGGLGGEGLESYTAPSERLADMLAEATDTRDRRGERKAARVAARQAEIRQFIASAGGEVG